MISKVFLSIVSILLVLLIAATTNVYFPLSNNSPSLKNPPALSTQAQLQIIDHEHPLLSMYNESMTSPLDTQKALTLWLSKTKRRQLIEDIYVLLIKRRIAVTTHENKLVSHIDEQLALLAQKNQLPWLKAWNIHNKAKSEIRLGNVKSAISLIDNALNISEQHNLEFLKINLYNSAAVAHNAQNNLIKSQQYFLKGLKLLEGSTDINKVTLFNNNLGLLYIHLEQWQSALDFLMQAEKMYISGKVNNPNLRMVILFNQSFAYNRMNMPLESRNAFESGMSFINKNTSDFIKVLALKAQTRLHSLEGDFEKAIHTAQQCIDAAQSHDYKKQIAICSLELSYAFKSNDQIDQALSSAISANIAFKTISHPRWVIKSHLLLAQLYERSGKKEAALQLYKSYYQEERALLFGELRALDNILEVQKVAQERDLLSAKNQIAQLETQFNEQRLQLMGLWMMVIILLMLWLTWRSIRIKQDNRHLYNLSYKDPLTGAANRHLYNKELLSPEALNTQNIYRLVVIDLDHFKQVNDNYGHDKGDIVLTETARRIMRFIERDELFVRWGGEEFLLVVKEREQFKEFIQTLIESINSTPIDLGDCVLFVTASFGCSNAENYQAIQSSSEAFKLADKCLYQAKQTGRNRVVMPQEL